MQPDLCWAYNVESYAMGAMLTRSMSMRSGCALVARGDMLMLRVSKARDWFVGRSDPQESLKDWTFARRHGQQRNAKWQTIFRKTGY